MKIRFSAILAATLTAISGCGPQVSQEELGTVMFDVPKFDPIEQPYHMPKLDAAPDKDQETEPHDHPHPHP
jgi:hypothetical protein